MCLYVNTGSGLCCFRLKITKICTESNLVFWVGNIYWYDCGRKFGNYRNTIKKGRLPRRNSTSLTWARNGTSNTSQEAAAMGLNMPPRVHGLHRHHLGGVLVMATLPPALYGLAAPRQLCGFHNQVLTAAPGWGLSCPWSLMGALRHQGVGDQSKVMCTEGSTGPSPGPSTAPCFVSY